MSEEQRRPLAGAALVFGAAALWATFGIFARALYERGFTPIELASIRAWIGFLGAALIAARKRSLLRIAPRDLPFFILYGVVGFAVFEYLYFAAIERTSVAVAVALLYTAPAFVVLLSLVLWKERIGPLKLAALALVMAGVLLVTGALRSAPAMGGTRGAAVTAGADVSVLAVLLGLGAGLTYGLYTIFSKISLRRYSPLTTLFWSFGFASLFLLPIEPPLAPALRSPSAIPLLLGLGMLPTLLAYFLYLHALRWLRASTASMLAAVEPMIAALLAAWLLREAVGGAEAAGMLLIVVAAILLARAAETESADPVITLPRRPW